MNDPRGTAKYSSARLHDRQTSELIGLARGLVADGYLNDAEVKYLYKWLAATETSVRNPVVRQVLERVEEVMEDGVVDEEERADLVSTLNALCANDFEVGETLKATTLPLCKPAPTIDFEGRSFCFTGTFVFGKRRACEEAATDRGARAGNLTKTTDFLVIGEYATDAWQQSSWGRKIEKAVAMKRAGSPINIVSEKHWREHL